MNNRRKYVFSTLLIIVVLLILSVSFLILRDYSKNVLYKNETKVNKKSNLKESNIKEESVKEVTAPSNESDINNNDTSAGNSTSTNTDSSNNNSNKENTASSNNDLGTSIDPNLVYQAIESYTGKITGYGPDCYGCTSFRTASGMYIGEGNIYYQDSTFGKTRIVAADKRYPFGTIVKISGLSIYQDPFYAVVLDRGGGIGDNKSAQFDLLFATESSATVVGLSTANFEILRLGY